MIMNMEGFEDIFDDDNNLDNNVELPLSTVSSLDSGDDLFPELTEEPIIEDNIINDLLKAKGIQNSTITIVDENDVEKEVNFYDLTREEQLEILNFSEESQEDILDENEIELINHLRTNNLSIEDFLTQYKESILAEVATSTGPVYDVDSYDDEELFLMDLKNKYELTDEELQIELEKELKNPELFAKKTTKLRTEYKQLEDQEKINQQLEFENQQKENYNWFAEAMSNVSNLVTDYHGVFLEDNEKTETLSYLLDLDESGTSKFSKDLNDPNKLYEAAWYLRYGKEAFEALESAYEAEIKKLKKEKEDKPRGFVQKSQPTIKNINDLI